jgi:adenine/guanine phosphoribosyltransferase-like PRPP-binding protein
VIVTDAVRDGSPIRAMTALIKRAGGSVVGVAVLAATTSDIGGVPAITTSAAKAGSEAVAT